MTEDDILKNNDQIEVTQESEASEKLITSDQETESHVEFYRRFQENYGISFSKGDMLSSSAEEQVDYLSEKKINNAQFLISKGRRMEEYLPYFKELKKNNPDALLSIHSSAPKFESLTNPAIKNSEKLLKDLEDAANADCGLVTIHPPEVPMVVWSEASEENQAEGVASLARFYAQAVAAANRSGKKLELAVENLPAKGNEGNWGQTPEQISLILEKTREVLVTQFGYKAEDAIAAIGMTLDIGHALAENKLEAESVLSKWLKELGQDIKCFHVGADSNLPMMEVKLRLLRELCEKYQIEVPIFLESKVDLATTEDIYDVTKIGLRS